MPGRKRGIQQEAWYEQKADESVDFWHICLLIHSKKFGAAKK